MAKTRKSELERIKARGPSQEFLERAREITEDPNAGFIPLGEALSKIGGDKRNRGKKKKRTREPKKS